MTRTSNPGLHLKPRHCGWVMLGVWAGLIPVATMPTQAIVCSSLNEPSWEALDADFIPPSLAYTGGSNLAAQPLLRAELRADLPMQGLRR